MVLCIIFNNVTDFDTSQRRFYKFQDCLCLKNMKEVADMRRVLHLHAYNLFEKGIYWHRRALMIAEHVVKQRRQFNIDIQRRTKSNSSNNSNSSNPTAHPLLLFSQFETVCRERAPERKTGLSGLSLPWKMNSRNDISKVPPAVVRGRAHRGPCLGRPKHLFVLRLSGAEPCNTCA